MCIRRAFGTDYPRPHNRHPARLRAAMARRVLAATRDERRLNAATANRHYDYWTVARTPGAQYEEHPTSGRHALCIRRGGKPLAPGARQTGNRAWLRGADDRRRSRGGRIEAVSYTHLTLPT